MPVKIRLARHGRKRYPFYHIVVADSRAPRDGRLIERVGSYNPNTNPPTVELNFDSALDWLQKGAQPTDTCRTILSENGVLLKKHLLEGVKKGAFNEDAAEEKFATWMKDKESKVKATIDKINKGQDSEIKERLAAETKVNEARAQAIAKKKSDLAAQLEAAAAAPAEEATGEEAPAAEATTEEAVEATAEAATEVTEAPAEEAKEEAPVEEAKEETPTEEVKDEAPAEEAKESAPANEETPAEAEAKEETPAEEEKKEDAAE